MSLDIGLAMFNFETSRSAHGDPFGLIIGAIVAGIAQALKCVDK